jgi:hypothetical protein
MATTPTSGSPYYFSLMASTPKPKPIVDNRKDCRVCPGSQYGVKQLYTRCPYPENWIEQEKNCKHSEKSKYTQICLYNRANIISDWCDCSEPYVK